MYYHISYRSDLTILVPKYISTGRRLPNESPDQCVCVAPSIKGCILAILGLDYPSEHMTIYKVLSDIEPISMEGNVPDFEYTREHRFYDVVSVEPIGILPTSLLLEIAAVVNEVIPIEIMTPDPYLYVMHMIDIFCKPLGY